MINIIKNEFFDKKLGEMFSVDIDYLLGFQPEDSVIYYKDIDAYLINFGETLNKWIDENNLNVIKVDGFNIDESYQLLVKFIDDSTFLHFKLVYGPFYND